MTTAVQHDAGDSLEARPSQRTAELELAQKRILELSRQANLAELVTGILHNVGNVLNSVNVSATILSDSLKKSRVSDVSRIADLLRTHKEDLASYLTTDPKGCRILEFLSQLAQRLAQEQNGQLRELEALHKNVAHIKEIVSMQQGYAKTSAATEIVQARDLVEDTLRLNAASLATHHVKVIRDFGEVPPLIVDKHKVLQILVNLVCNAKHACEELGQADKRITVSVRNSGERVAICVVDNGVGIPRENLTRIFTHGFTTKKDGHGFGLHSGAIAAKELGGVLTAHSEGPGRGAVFTLELPLQCPGHII